MYLIVMLIEDYQKFSVISYHSFKEFAIATAGIDILGSSYMIQNNSEYAIVSLNRKLECVSAQLPLVHQQSVYP